MASQVEGRACMLVVLLATLWAIARACSPVDGFTPMSPADDIKAADVVLYGRIEHTYPDERFSYGGTSTVYTAEMRVYCILKGPKTGAVINITEAGYVPGHCTSTDLDAGSEYILPLSTQHNLLYPAYAQLDATEGNLLMAAEVCGLKSEYPIGVKAETAKVKCPVITAKNCGKDEEKRCFGDGCYPKSEFSHSGASSNTSRDVLRKCFYVIIVSVLVMNLRI